MHKTKIAEVVAHKGSSVYTISPNDTVYDALKLMADFNVGCLLVKENESIAGMISERDYARKIILCEKSSPKTKVAEIMSLPVVTISPQETVDDALAIMVNKTIRHLPVIDDRGDLVGVVSIGDLVKTIIENQQKVIQHMESYIQGS